MAITEAILRTGVLLLVGLAPAWTGILSHASYAAESEVDFEDERHLLYVASPGVRDYLEWGGQGILVFDADRIYQFVKRISLDRFGQDESGKVLNVKGICAHSGTHRLYVSTLRQLLAIDLLTDQVLWQREFDQGCDRMAIAPDGRTIYLPSLERDVWYVVDADQGAELQRLAVHSRSHNTVYGLDGRSVYLAGLGSPWLSVAETSGHTIARRVGPFSDAIRPFTVNGSQTFVFANTNGLLGFEVGDLRTGKLLHRVQVSGFALGTPKRHGCPSHGIGLTPDETELWLCDGFNSHVHIFDATSMPPRQRASILLREQPGWVTFSLKGHHAFLSTGEIIDVATRRIIAALSDEQQRPVHSEKMVEIDFRGSHPIRNGDQFGIGRANRTVP